MICLQNVTPTPILKPQTLLVGSFNKSHSSWNITRPDTRLPQSHAGGQGPYLRSLHHLGRSSEAKEHKNPKKVKCDGPTDGRTKGWTDKASSSFHSSPNWTRVVLVLIPVQNLAWNGFPRGKSFQKMTQQICLEVRHVPCLFSKGAFLVTGNCVFNGPLGRSLLSFARTTHSAHSLCSAPLRSASLRSLCSLAPFTGSLTHFAHSLVRQLKFLNIYIHAVIAFHRNKRVFGAH